MVGGWRRYWTLLPVAAAVGAWLFAWGRVCGRIRANDSPARFVQWVGEHSESDGSMPHCHGPAIADGDSVWRSCEYSLKLGGEKGGGLIRFDLARRQARMDWRVGDSLEDARVRLAALEPSGDLLVVTLENRLLRFRAAGGVEQLGALEAVALGIAATQDGFEVVVASFTSDAIRVAVRRFAGGEVTTRPLGTLACGAEDYCDSGRAHRRDGAWEAFLTRMSRHASDPADVEVLALREDRPAERVQSLSVQTGEDRADFIRPIDPTFAGIASLESRPLVYEQGQWRALWPPGADGSKAVRDGEVVLLLSDGTVDAAIYSFAGHTMSRMLRWVNGRWVVLEGYGESMTVGPLDGAPVGLDNSDRWIDTLALLVPSSSGGYWLLGAFGTHVRLDESFARVDALGFGERLWRPIDEFDRLRVYNDFYLESPGAKTVGYLLLLFLFPALAVVLVVASLVLRWNRSRVAYAYAAISIVYLICFAYFGSWFWRLTRDM